jgi:hypothetical protein
VLQEGDMAMVEHLASAVPGRPDGAGLQVLQSCSFTWIFDDEAHRFRRVPRGAPVGLKVPAPWAAYHRLDIDECRSCFTVALDGPGTWILRVSLHGDPCPHCRTARHG